MKKLQTLMAGGLMAIASVLCGSFSLYAQEQQEDPVVPSGPSYTVQLKWLNEDVAGIASNARQAVGHNGKFYILNSHYNGAAPDGQGTIEVWDATGKINDIRPDGGYVNGTNITIDDAGNIIARSGAFPSDIKDRPGVFVYNPQTKVKKSFNLDANKIMVGRNDFWGHVSGNVMSANGGYLMFGTSGQSMFNEVKIAGAQHIVGGRQGIKDNYYFGTHPDGHAMAIGTTGFISNYDWMPNEAVFMEGTADGTTVPNPIYHMTYGREIGGTKVWDFDGIYVTPDRNVTAGFALFQMGGETYIVYSRGGNNADAFAIAKAYVKNVGDPDPADAESLVVYKSFAIMNDANTDVKYKGTFNTAVHFNVEVKYDQDGYETAYIYQYCPSHFIAVYEFKIEGSAPSFPRPLFQEDGFDYSYENFYNNFSYTYVDEATGETVTVPLTTPATTPNAMKALIKEVYTNRAIPGRKWIHGGSNVHYTVGAISEDLPDTYNDYDCFTHARAAEIFGIEPGDYTPYDDGLTCLLVEGIDRFDDYTADDFYYDTNDIIGYDENHNPIYRKVYRNNFHLIKSIRLVTSRVAIGMDNKVTDGKGNVIDVDKNKVEPHSPASLNNPGYIFNVNQPLYKFFFLTKGKPRRLKIGLPTMFNLFEEYSPNDGQKETTSKDVYNDLKDGKRFTVNHDCSSVITNQGHIMKMQSPDGDYAVNTNLSFFVPFYRNYNDTGAHTNEIYTWYDPLRQPFLYYYSIKLKADAVPTPGHEEETYDVTISWDTNFRNFFHTEHDGEFYVYKVINGVPETTPIVFVQSNQAETSVFPDGRVLSHSQSGVSAMYHESRETSTRNIYYIVAGRPLDLACEFTQSNIDRVTIPGLGEDLFLEIAIEGQGNSNHDIEAGENNYINTVVAYNRTDEFAFNSDHLRTGGRFIIKRRASDSPTAPVTTLGYLEVVAPANGEFYELQDGVDEEGNHVQFEVYKLQMHIGNVPQKAPQRVIVNLEDTPNTIYLKAKHDENIATVVTNMDGGLRLFAWQDNFYDEIQEDPNKQKTLYQYRLAYEAPAAVIDGEHLDAVDANSNIESFNVLLAQLQIAPETFSNLDVDSELEDGKAPKLVPGDFDVWVLVHNLPTINTYRIFGHKYSGDELTSTVFGTVRNSDGVFTVTSLNKETGLQEQYGEPFSIEVGKYAYVRVPIDADMWENTQFIVSEVCAPIDGVAYNEVDDNHYRSYGSPRATPNRMPEIQLTTPVITKDKTTGKYTSKFVAETNIYDMGELGSWNVSHISHYAIWRSVKADPKNNYETVDRLIAYPGFRHYGEAEYSGSENGQWGKIAKFSVADDLLDGEGNDIGGIDERDIEYTIRVYIALDDYLSKWEKDYNASNAEEETGNEEGPSNAPAKAPELNDDDNNNQPAEPFQSDENYKYILLEKKVMANLTNNYTTGIEDVAVGEGALAIDANGNITGNGPVAVYDIAGRMVITADSADDINDAALPAGIYIVRNAVSSLKIAK